MSTAYFNFHPSLNFFLQPDQRNRMVTVHFRGRQTLKHLIESLGIPHTEVGSLRSASHHHHLTDVPRDGEHLEVLPAANEYPAHPRFLLDNHLGRLAAHLRMLGFDCRYQNDYDDEQLSQLAEAEERILLTRDRRLLMRKVIHAGYCPRSLDPDNQLLEVVHRFKLNGRFTPFHRCLRCNERLAPVDKASILDRLEPLTRLYFDEFQRCPNCDQIYWKGSHYQHMLELIQSIEGQAGHE